MQINACLHASHSHTCPIWQVRISALHALKTVCKLRPAMLRASGCAFAAATVPAVVSGCQNTRHQPLHSAAQRTLMHVLTVCGWSDAAEPPAELKGQADAAAYVVDFARKSHRRLAALESEAEHSDDDPV